MYTCNKSPKEVNPKESKKGEKRDRTDDTSRKHKMMLFHLNSNISLTTLNVNSIVLLLK